MNLTLFVTEECQTCERVMSDLKQLAKNNSEVNLHIINIQNANPKNIVIVPALFWTISFFRTENLISQGS